MSPKEKHHDEQAKPTTAESWLIERNPAKQLELERKFGVRYLDPGAREVISSKDDEMYSYVAFVGPNIVDVDRGDCCFVKRDNTAVLKRGPCRFTSPEFAAVVRGYAPPEKTADLAGRMVLPYVNGCSTRQIFPPERPGDPTLQMLTIPPYSAEQAHHIHSTVRVVFVLAGRGYSIVGMEKQCIAKELVPGMVVVLDNMCPHHFETEESSVVVLPVHVWSALPGAVENNHPMFNGTFLMNQGQR
jgi:hypothetical protein